MQHINPLIYLLDQQLTYEDAKMVAAKVASKAYEKASQLKHAGIDFFA